uniref:Uncharacterized protein n=1 Tax=Salix viminalis TaxID=40686 RepID=A0A6N2JWZ1_SALVM
MQTYVILMAKGLHQALKIYNKKAYAKWITIYCSRNGSLELPHQIEKSMDSSPRSSITGKVKRTPWWMKSLTGWSYVIFEMLFQKMQARRLKNPLPLPPLHDVTCIVTGSTSGIGLETARQLAVSGAHVVMAVRNQSAALDLIMKWQDERHGTSLLSVEVMELNLLSLASVVRFARAWNLRSKPLQVLINNAGIFSMGRAAEVLRRWVRNTPASKFFGSCIAFCTASAVYNQGLSQPNY